jgi:hypothetical protein
MQKSWVFLNLNEGKVWNKRWVVGDKGHAVAYLVEALCYKPESPRFHSQ